MPCQLFDSVYPVLCFNYFTLLLRPVFYWWGRGDSNSHALQHMILNHARLPVPTLPPIRRDNQGVKLAPRVHFSVLTNYYSDDGQSRVIIATVSQPVHIRPVDTGRVRIWLKRQGRCLFDQPPPQHAPKGTQKREDGKHKRQYPE